MIDFTDQIICGDCLEVMQDIPDHSIDLIITDPPYFIPAEFYQTRIKYRRNFADLGLLDAVIKPIFVQFERILRTDAHIYIFCDGKSYPLFFYHAFPIAKAVRPIIWDKQALKLGFGWRHQHEIILWVEMPNSKPIPTGDGDIIRCKAVPPNNRKHIAEKPLELITRLVEKSSKEGDTVLDPFVGSGVTAIAAKACGRNYIGIDIGAEYCAIAEKRLAEML